MKVQLNVQCTAGGTMCLWHMCGRFTLRLKKVQAQADYGLLLQRGGGVTRSLLVARALSRFMHTLLIGKVHKQAYYGLL